MLPTADSKPEKEIETDNDDINRKLVKIWNTDEIFKIVLENIAIILWKSKKGMTAVGPLTSSIGNEAENMIEFNNKILNGEILAEDYVKHYPEYEEAREMIMQMSLKLENIFNYTATIKCRSEVYL